MGKYRVLSLFSGAGGMDLGFINSGFEIVWANDFLEEAVVSYRSNIGNHIVFGDITEIPSKSMPDNIDIVIGGFPCQGFSVANTRRSMEDKRNFLYKEMLRIIRDKSPSFFVAENVKGLLSLEGGKVFEMIKNDFSSLGYKVDARILNAAEYGVPQARERIVIIGNRLGLENPYPKKTHYIPEALSKRHSLAPAITTEQAVGFLNDIRLSKSPIALDNSIIYSHMDKTKIDNKQDYWDMLGADTKTSKQIICNHIAAINVEDRFWGRKYNVNQHDICDYLKFWRDKASWTTKAIDEYFGYAYTAGHWFRKDNNSGSIPKPDDWWKLKEILGFDDKYDKEVTTFVEKEIKFEQSLRITNWDRPSDTITATSPEIHVNRKRRMSARECAILQTFPLNYQFAGNLNKIYTQIGNAVPVKLAEKFSKCIRDALDDYYKRFKRENLK